MSKRKGEQIDAKAESKNKKFTQCLHKLVARHQFYYVVVDDQDGEFVIHRVFKTKEEASEFKIKKEAEIKVELEKENEMEFFNELIILEKLGAKPLSGQVLVIMEVENGDPSILYLGMISDVSKVEENKEEILKPGLEDYLETIKDDHYYLNKEDMKGLLDNAKSDYFIEHRFYSKVLTL